jgi:hypothetical protein
MRDSSTEWWIAESGHPEPALVEFCMPFEREQMKLKATEFAAKCVFIGRVRLGEVSDGDGQHFGGEHLWVAENPSSSKRRRPEQCGAYRIPLWQWAPEIPRPFA